MSHRLSDIDVDLVSPERPALRIAVVTETYPPDINGVARTLAITVQGLRARGHTIRVIRPRHPQESAGASAPDLAAVQAHDPTPRDAAQATAYAGEDLLVRGFPIPFYRQLRMGLPAKRALHRLWSVHRPDVVHIATEGPLGWSALKVARKLRLPVSTDFRTNFHAYTRHYGVGWLKTPIMSYLRKFHNAADSTMVPTAQLRDELAAVGFERLHVVPRGVDVQRFDPTLRSTELRAQWGAGPDDVVLLCVARMATEKNLHLVLDLHRQLLAQHPRLRLVMVGDGPLREAFQRDYPEAIFTGFLGEVALATHYASADIFVFPSVTETFGNVSLEAMASGLAVVAFDDAAARYLIRHADNGMLAPCGDAPVLQAHVATLLADPALRQAIGRQARETACGKSWEHIFVQVEQTLQGVTSVMQSSSQFLGADTHAANNGL